MAVGIVATLTIQAGKGAEFEAAFGELQAAVRANEPGSVYYDLFKENETTYVVMEKYVDEAAAKAHGEADHFKTLGAALGPFMGGAPEIRRLTFVN